MTLLCRPEILFHTFQPGEPWTWKNCLRELSDDHLSVEG